LFRATRRENIFLIELEHPGGFPRLDREILLSLRDALREAVANSSVSGMVIAGAEKAFAVGAEISELAALTPLAAHEFSLLGQSVMSRIERSSKPVIAAIRGYCFGGGLDLALACHVRIASEDASSAHPGASLGIFTGWGGTQRLPRTLLPGARSRALELFSTGRAISAPEAFRLGLVTRIISAAEIVSHASELASRHARSHP
jgi:enoyl-CoA hydratase